MGYTNTETDDLEKLREALSYLLNMFTSVDGLLEAFGLSHMPQAQRYGILFGCLVFACTITAVIFLLAMGGTFQRLKDQEFGDGKAVLSATDARSQRALLLEELLEGRNRLMSKYPPEKRSPEVTQLTSMLLNVTPQKVPSTKVKDTEFVHTTSKQAEYQENYVKGYRVCQDRPGGAPMGGRPEARFEAYARAFAGCGSHTTPSYRRSYARLHEAVACQHHASDDKYAKLFLERPQDIIGRHVRLEALEADRHLADLYKITSGEAVFESSSYDPNEVWGFLEEGPFESEQQMKKSFVFQRQPNEAAFAIVNNVTDRLVGAILLTRDDPKNLTIQMEAPLVPPSRQGTQDEIEACFLLMDRLFAHGYRRIQFSIDSQDATLRKLTLRLGLTLEGVLYKHQIVKEASRDSNIYSMLNSDWKNGARASLYKKLYGAAALRHDQTNEKSEEEFEEQERILAAKKKLEEAQGQGEATETASLIEDSGVNENDKRQANNQSSKKGKGNVKDRRVNV